MNRFTAVALAGALSASVVSWGCHNKDNEEHHHHHVTATSGPVAGAADSVGGALNRTGEVTVGAANTTGAVTVGAAKKTGEVTVDAAKTTVEVAGGAAKTTGDAVADASKTTGNVVGDAAKTTGDAVGDAAKTTGDAADGAADLAAEKISGKSATAEIAPSTAPGNDDVKGTVHFEAKGDGVHVHAKISGLEPNSEHGFHIHEKADLTAPDLSSAKGHFNPTHMKHGGAEGEARHGGDLGNLKADDKGNADYEVDVMGVSIDGKENGIVGHSVIIHAKADDLKTDPSGNSGDRIAGGAITADTAKKAPAGEKDASNDAKKDIDNAK